MIRGGEKPPFSFIIKVKPNSFVVTEFKGMEVTLSLYSLDDEIRISIPSDKELSEEDIYKNFL